MSHNIMLGFLFYLLKDRDLTTDLNIQTNENYLLTSDNNFGGREYKLSIFSVLAFYRSSHIS